MHGDTALGCYGPSGEKSGKGHLLPLLRVIESGQCPLLDVRMPTAEELRQDGRDDTRFHYATQKGHAV